jgi:hypothetical protein
MHIACRTGDDRAVDLLNGICASCERVPAPIGVSPLTLVVLDLLVSPFPFPLASDADDEEHAAKKNTIKLLSDTACSGSCTNIIVAMNPILRSTSPQLCALRVRHGASSVLGCSHELQGRLCTQNTCGRESACAAFGESWAMAHLATVSPEYFIPMHSLAEHVSNAHNCKLSPCLFLDI